MISDKFPAAQEKIKKARRVILSTHEEPDIDGLGSMLALTGALRQTRADVIPFSPSILSGGLNILPGTKYLAKQPPPFNPSTDLIIGLDYGHIRRLEIARYYPCPADALLTFDHHLLDGQIGLIILDAACSATAEIIYHFLNFLHFPINNDIATCLLAGIISDTNFFRHANTSAVTLKIAEQLMIRGGRWQKIFTAREQVSPRQKAAVINQALQNMTFNRDSGLLFSHINHQTFIQSADIFKESRVANILANAPEARLALFLIEKAPGIFEGSLRAQIDREIDAAAIARRFNGGGHRLAAGFRSHLSAKEIIATIETQLLARVA